MGIQKIGMVSRNNIYDWAEILYKDGKESLVWSTAYPLVIFMKLNVTVVSFGNGPGRDTVWNCIIRMMTQRSFLTGEPMDLQPLDLTKEGATKWHSNY